MKLVKSFLVGPGYHGHARKWVDSSQNSAEGLLQLRRSASVVTCAYKNCRLDSSNPNVRRRYGSKTLLLLAFARGHMQRNRVFGNTTSLVI